MTALKTIVATAVIVVAGTTAAFAGLHAGQPSANAASPTASQPTKSQATYAVRLTEKQLEHLADLLGGHHNAARHTQRSQHQVVRQTKTQHDDAATHDQAHASAAGSTTRTHHSETDHSGTMTATHDGSHRGTHDGGSGHGGSGCD